MNMDRINYLNKLKLDSVDDPFPIYALGMEYLNSDLSQSISYFEEVRTKFPDYLPVYYQLGSLYDEIGKETKAVEILREGIILAKANNKTKTERELKQLLEQLEL